MSSESLAAVRIALETSALCRPGKERGLGRYTTACLEAARSEAHSVAEVSLEPRGNARVAEFLDVARRSIAMRNVDCDLFHATNPYVCAVGVRQVTSVLDVIPLDVAAHRKTGLKAEVFYRYARQSGAVLTLSEFSAARVVALLGCPEDRVFVATLPPAPAFFAPHPAERDDAFVLSLVDLATPDPRKRAFWIPPLAKRLAERRLPLVVAGAGTIDGLNGIPNVEALGRVSDQELASLYASCSAFAYFSAYEGQGLPPLEAMAAGAPVVAFRNSAVAEVVAGGGVLLEEPGDLEAANIAYEPWMEDALDELADSVSQLAADAALRAQYKVSGQKRAAEFSQARFASSVASAYSAAL